jgi:hypothetical protein
MSNTLNLWQTRSFIVEVALDPKHPGRITLFPRLAQLPWEWTGRTSPKQTESPWAYYTEGGDGLKR